MERVTSSLVNSVQDFCKELSFLSCGMLSVLFSKQRARSSVRDRHTGTGLDRFIGQHSDRHKFRFTHRQTGKHRGREVRK